MTERLGDRPVLHALHRALQAGLHVERRLEPFFRREAQPSPARAHGGPAAMADQLPAPRTRGSGSPRNASCRTRRKACQSIIASFAGYMPRTYPPGRYERGGNTKTHGVVRAEVRDPRRPAGASAARRLRRAADLPGLCALLGPGSRPAGGHPRRRLLQHGRQAHGRAGPQADGRRAAHPGPDRRLHADLRHAQHARERQAAALELPATCRSSTSSTRWTRTCSTS